MTLAIWELLSLPWWVPSGNEQITTHLFTIGPNAPDYGVLRQIYTGINTTTYTAASDWGVSPGSSTRYANHGRYMSAGSSKRTEGISVQGPFMPSMAAMSLPSARPRYFSSPSATF